MLLIIIEHICIDILQNIISADNQFDTVNHICFALFIGSKNTKRHETSNNHLKKYHNNVF